MWSFIKNAFSSRGTKSLATANSSQTQQTHAPSKRRHVHRFWKSFMQHLVPFKYRKAPICRVIKPDEAIDAKHPRPLNDYNFELPNRGLKYSCYSPHDIPTLLGHIISTRPPLKAKYQKMLSSEIPMASSADKLKQLLDSWMGLLDDWFFAGSLKSILKGVNFRRLNGHEFDGLESSHGLYSRFERKIWIQIARRSRVEAYMCTYEEYFISVLLHEMVHAFIDLHHCQKSCCMDKGLKLKHASQGHLGKGCHGPPFADSLKLLQDTLQKSVKWYVWDTIPPSVSQDMKAEHWRARDEQLEHWNMKNDFLANLGGWNPEGLTETHW